MEMAGLRLAGLRTVDADPKSLQRLWTGAVTLLAVAACAQAFAFAVVMARDATADGRLTVVSGQLVLDALPLCFLALAGTVPLCLRRPLAAAVTVSAAALVLLAGFDRITVTGALAVLLAVFRLGLSGSGTGARNSGSRSTGSRSTGSRGQFLAVALGVPFLVMAAISRDVPAVLLAAGVPMAAATGIAVRASRLASGEDAARTVLTDTLTEHLARGERARIARELHDVVAHHISMIAVRAETARLTTPGLPDAGAARLREIGDTARAGLTEMRRLLGVLREDVSAREVGERRPQPGLPQVAALVDAAREASGASASMRLIVSGPVASFDPGMELVAYRIVQEALTNARRHAPGAAVDVELRYETDALRLRVRDNGPGPAPTPGGPPAPNPPAPGSSAPGSSAPGSPAPNPPAPEPAGHGLLGMRERAATVGGSVVAGPAPGGGFQVAATLPVTPPL
jgi:signal transduction histidine kinase